ncbi:MAG: DUF86 domain-containing protein [Thermoproteota archaeon]|nr:MAG: DUF86 domain-containing protein [Candidatus Korarchaeota archaeon]
MEIDKDLIHLRIDLIEKNLKLLGEIASEGYESFEKSYRDMMASKHALLESIEACLDIANHIIAVKGFRRPMDYSDIFRILEEEGIIDEDLSLRLQRMAKFRNLLVHRYAEIETRKLFTIMTKDVKDLMEFVKVVLRIIREQRPR